MVKYFTKQALDKLKKELNHLGKVKRKEIAERIKHAASFGDLKENAAYHEAKESQGFLEGRILDLKAILSQAEIINKKETNKVQIGSIVLLVSNGKKEKFQVVEPEEADVSGGKISYRSPLGKILLGKSIGSEIKIKTPDREVEYKIVEIK